MEAIEELLDAWSHLRVHARVEVSLPHLAAEALAEGFDSPALRELAGLGIRDDVEARHLLPVVLQELGWPVTDIETAAWDVDADRHHQPSALLQGLGTGATAIRQQAWGDIVTWEEARAQFAFDFVDHTEQALALVRRDLEPIEDTVGCLNLFWLGRYAEEGGPLLLVGFDEVPFLGPYSYDPDALALSGDLPHRVLAIAAAAQECVMELFQFYWPDCAPHRRGLHLPEPDSMRDATDWPTWRCRAEGGHNVAPLGFLIRTVDSAPDAD